VNETRARVADIVSRLERVRTASLAVGILSALGLGIVALGGAWLAITILDMGLGLGAMPLRIIAVLLLVGALGVAGYKVARIFVISHSIQAYAARIGAEIKEVGLDLLTALDLADIDNSRLGYSTVFMDKVIGDISARVRTLDLQAGVGKRQLALVMLPVAAILVLVGVWFRIDASSLSYSATRLAFFWGISDNNGIVVAVEPGDVEVPAGADVGIGAEVTGFVRGTPMLHVVSDGEETAFRMDRAGAPAGGGKARYEGTVAAIDRDMAYFVTLAGQATRHYGITVSEEPEIKRGTITLNYPAYTGLGSEVLAQGIWDIVAPYGTVAAMEFVANCSPDSAWVVLADSTGWTERLPLAVEGDSLRLETRIGRSSDYTVEMAAGRPARSHGPHSIIATRDKAPYVRIESPAKEIMLETDMVIPLSVVALDDYGISSMKLFYRCPGETSFVALPYSGKTQARCDYNWDTGFLNVIPGDVITYYVEVADNDALTGPKHARTEDYMARVPTLFDFYEDVEDQQDQDLAALKEAAERAKEIKDEFDKISEDIKRSNDIGWEEQQAIKQNLADQQEVRDKVEEFQKSLDETLDRMGENPLVSFEIIEKMEEIRRLFDEVATEEMKESIRKLQEAMEKLSPEEIRAAMQDIEMSQEELLEKLERTLQMLKRLKLQQDMEAVLNLAERIAQGQEEVNDMLRQDGDLKEAQTRENGLAGDTEGLDKMMEELAGKLEQEGNPIAGQVARAGEFMEGSRVGEHMKSAASAMSEERRADALGEGEQAAGSLTQLADMLRQARDALTGEDKKQVMEALTKAMNGLREVSARHEQVLDRIESPEEVSTSDLARMEMVYKEALDGIAEDLLDVSRKSLFVSPMLGRSVLNIGSTLQEVSQMLSQGMKAKTRADARSSLGALNQLVTGIMDAMEKASSCSSPSGMCSAFDKLNGMCAMQMGINAGTQSILSEGEEGMSMEARARMARLAAQQESVRKGLQEIADEFGDRAEILGRLDDLVEEARRVVEDMNRGGVDRETVRRQEEILTRMLNAQRSMRRRDYSERRRSRPGEAYEAKPPPELSGQEREELMRDLLYQRRGYYPPEYEELIRAYFKALSAGKGAR
jgi:ABC-type multidrug transport system fused ATPase/permease subunit